MSLKVILFTIITAIGEGGQVSVSTEQTQITDGFNQMKTCKQLETKMHAGGKFPTTRGEKKVSYIEGKANNLTEIQTQCIEFG